MFMEELNVPSNMHEQKQFFVDILIRIRNILEMVQGYK